MRIKPTTTSPDDSAGLLRTLADPVRLRLLCLLTGREVCVCHLHEALELPQPTVSRHLAHLRRAGLVVGRKEGLWVHYRLASDLGELERSLLVALGETLADHELIRSDRDRLARIACC